MSREVPMLFSGHLVRAILEGRKTQTRRPMKMRYSPETDVVANPPCSPGDTLWVRETFGNMALPGYEPVWLYRADNKPGDDALLKQDGFRWSPSIHMPRWAARLFLPVVEVRAERICDISEADAVAEGFESRAAFLDAWLKIYGPNPDALTDYCWVIEFKRKEVANGPC